MKPNHIKAHTTAVRAAILKLIQEKGFSPDSFMIMDNGYKSYDIIALKGDPLTDQKRFKITLHSTTSRKYKEMVRSSWRARQIDSGEVVGLPLAFINQLPAYFNQFGIIPRETLKEPYQEPTVAATMYDAFPHPRASKIDNLLNE
ncbi:hypothetical protein [Hymenobacter sp. APR13]|uniref:hypothetical protein n=1 Tax=Hymenobacter sp. APR13 TaxID=1356852 RepID=UPI0004E09011|nr:hypothetical protein [Hymenobacter sp. APR13]AII50385.1 hypothetical protein N008_00095 [Hymenobacter sp. APR13]